MPRKGSEIVDIPVTIEVDTGKAWLVISHYTNKKVWVGYFQGEIDAYSNSTKTATLTIPTHIAEEKELV